MKTVGANRNAFRDSEEKIDAVMPKRSMAPVCCSAEGCPCGVQILDDPESGRGLCGYHAFADSKLWPKITEILNSPTCKKLRWTLHRLEHNLDGEPQDINAMIVDVQSAAQAFGLPLDVYGTAQLSGLINRKKVDFKEPARVYAYRMSMTLMSVVVSRAKGTQNFSIDHERRRGLSWTEKALAEIAGRGKALMA